MIPKCGLVGGFPISIGLHTPLAEQSVTRKVIDRIKQALLSGELKPGDRLPTENELCQIWQVSRTPIREAVKVLEFMGILEIRRSEGTYVCSEIKPAALNPLLFRLLFMTDSVDHLLEFRYAVEAMVLRVAVEKATPEHLDAMRENIRAMQEVMAGSASPDDLVELDLQFHDLMGVATSNPLLRELSREIHHMFAESIKLSHIDPTSNEALAHHSGLLQALERRDVEGGEAILHQSLQVWRRYVARGGDKPA